LQDYKPRTLTKQIPVSTKDDIFYINPTYILQFDIKDNNGNVMYPKGYKFNPLHFTTLTNNYVFFDFTNKKQVKWIKQNKIDKDIKNKFIITNGKIFKAIDFFGRDIYYADDKLIDRFGIKATLSIATQEGDRILVYQYHITDKTLGGNNGK